MSNKTIGRMLEDFELAQIYQAFQDGIEILGWYHPLPEKLTSETAISIMDTVLAQFKAEGVSFPVGEYHSYRALANVLALTYGYLIAEEFGWEWRYVNDPSYLGFILIHQPFNIALELEEWFYSYLMYEDVTFHGGPIVYTKIHSGYYTQQPICSLILPTDPWYKKFT